MMEFLANKYEKTSECISIWIKEIENFGYRSFAYDSEALDHLANDNSKVNTIIDISEEDAFVVQDPFCVIDESNVVRYEREDDLDDNAGVKGDCSVFLKCGYELNGSWRKGKRHGAGLICGPALEAKGIKVIWGKYVGKDVLTLRPGWGTPPIFGSNLFKSRVGSPQLLQQKGLK